jgi:hypothetical protein
MRKPRHGLRQSGDGTRVGRAALLKAAVERTQRIEAAFLRRIKGNVSETRWDLGTYGLELASFEAKIAHAAAIELKAGDAVETYTVGRRDAADHYGEVIVKIASKYAIGHKKAVVNLTIGEE